MILLDTCGLLWLAQGAAVLSETTRRAIDEEPIVPVSAISAFEISLKQQVRKLALPTPAIEWWSGAVAKHGLNVIDLSPEILIRATLLPPIHRDPADRFIIATAVLSRGSDCSRSGAGATSIGRCRRAGRWTAPTGCRVRPRRPRTGRG